MAFKGVMPAGKLKPARYGLFSVADVSEKGGQDDHWGQGFEAMSEACTFDAEIHDICGGVPPVKVYEADGDRFQTVRPFGVVAFDRCLSIGTNADDRRARVIRQLEAVTPKAIEREFWSGVYRAGWEDSLEPGEVVSPGFLASELTTAVDAAAQKPEVALALLEQAVADCGPGFRAVIHLSPLVASILGNDLEEVDGRLVTNSGNDVAVGQGYDGRGPGEDGPESKFVHWMYATGPVKVVLGSKELITTNETQWTDATTNMMTLVAERPAAIYTDGCCQLGAKTDIRL